METVERRMRTYGGEGGMVPIGDVEGCGWHWGHETVLRAGWGLERIAGIGNGRGMTGFGEGPTFIVDPNPKPVSLSLLC